ncbi:Eco57I restriction-modification methylase domain-containing protein [Candidatus Poriferisocius sp.]|uniref:Eco57I restriction-modification methylase domain-containing protein n=1 Tax=Candidatus Poriferisocius sp. TaxID=3101276 RepID=UPI003B5C240F
MNHEERAASLNQMNTGLLAGLEERRLKWSMNEDTTMRSHLGQFFTPEEVAVFMANMLEVTPNPVRLLDPGAGIGSLAAAATARWHNDGGGALEVSAVESDPRLHLPLRQTLTQFSQIHDMTSTIIPHDFMGWATNQMGAPAFQQPSSFDVVIMNPPYRKIHSTSGERRILADMGIRVPNLYAAFVALAIALLKRGGQIVAITPRSFTNGPYFREFRNYLLKEMGLHHIHLLDSRDIAFADSNVLQENVIFYGIRRDHPESILISASKSVTEPITARRVPREEVIRPRDPESFIHIAPTEESAEYARQILQLPLRLPELNLQVSTGPVVDFRVKEHLRQQPNYKTVPLIYPTHLREGSVVWPQENGRKPNALVRCDATEGLLMPSGYYVLTKRFSSKEERRRVTATVVAGSDFSCEAVAFENHLNVFHHFGQGLSESLARGLALFLNTTTVDQYFRQFNGHTQVNATDLRNLRYPTLETLIQIGNLARPGMVQVEIDDLAFEHISTFSSKQSAE